MLPVTDYQFGAKGSSQPMVDYALGGSAIRTLTSRRWQHMDFEYALWLMANLCTSPRTAFRTTLYHSRTKHQWARDDPAFVVVLLYLLLVATLSWSLAFAQRSPLQVISLFLYVATIDFLLLGMALSAVGWWVSNNYLRIQSAPQSSWSTAAAEQQVAANAQPSTARPGCAPLS